MIFYFAQIYPYYPGMRDASGMTALERYRIALVKYGDQLNGQGKYCDAVTQYEAAYQLGPDGALDPTATAVYNLCHPPQPTQPPASTPTPTLTPTPSPTTGIIPPTNTVPAPPTAVPPTAEPSATATTAPPTSEPPTNTPSP